MEPRGLTMPKKNLTARFVESVTVDARTEFWDTILRGLVLRVTPAGAKSWSLVYRRESDGAKRRLTLGTMPTMPLAKARAAGLAELAKVAEGDDPAGKKAEQRKADTFADLASLFLEKHSRPNKRTWREDERMLNNDVLPVIGAMRVHKIDKRAIRDVLEPKVERGHRTSAERMRVMLSKLFNWAIEHDYVESNPAAAVARVQKPVSRDRVLSVAERTKLLKALPEASVTTQMRVILELLLRTGQRSGEVCGMRRNEVDVEAGLWTLPAERTKNARAHEVPLVGEALALVEQALEAAPPEPDAPVFAVANGRPIASNAPAQAVRTKLQVLEARWTPHDLRRTCATGMADAGVLPHVIEAVLNHISGSRSGVAGVYNRASYAAEKREALLRWDAALAEGSNVVPLTSTHRDRIGSGTRTPAVR